jgi:hypothetical protein
MHILTSKYRMRQNTTSDNKILGQRKCLRWAIYRAPDSFKGGTLRKPEETITCPIAAEIFEETFRTNRIFSDKCSKIDKTAEITTVPISTTATTEYSYTNSNIPVVSKILERRCSYAEYFFCATKYGGGTR